MALCEWDPLRDEPAKEQRLNGKTLRWGCDKPATLSVGLSNNWHLCDSCAALPRFMRLRRREVLREIAERLGTTRGAVIGKADRMGLPPHALTSGGRGYVTQSPGVLPEPGVAVSDGGAGTSSATAVTPHDDRETGDSVVIPDDGLQGRYQDSAAAHEALALADSSLTADWGETPQVVAPRTDESLLRSPHDGMVALWIDPHSPMSVFAMGLMLAMDGASELNVAGAAVAWPENMPLFTDRLHDFADWLIDFEAAFRALHGDGNAAALAADPAQ